MRKIVVSTPPPHSTSEMISIPLKPILELWVKRYRVMEKKLEKTRREWQLFEENANPHYQKWYYSTFAENLSKLTDWNERARAEEAVIAGIVAHQRVYRLDEFEAYRRVKERVRLKLGPYPDQMDIERYEAEQRARAETERKRREAAQEKRRKESEAFWASEAEALAYSADLQDAFEQRFGRDDDGDGEAINDDAIKSPSPEPQREKRQDDIRSLYRSIVRELHPDTGHEMTAVEKEWWNQAQVAYRNGDIETLKLLALRIQGQGKVEIESVDHVGTLIDLCTAIYEQQEQLERQRKHLKRDPVYRFWMSRTRSTSRDKLTFDLRAQLEHQLRRLKEFVSEVKSRLNELDRMTADFASDNEDEEFNPRKRHRARVNAGGRGRGRGRGR